MDIDRTPPKDIDEYIAKFPKDVQEVLEKIRATIKEAAPNAEETISYGMPAFTFKGNLVYFAAHKKHIGFYPGSAGIEKFKNELSDYEGAKGTVRFPFGKPIPYDIITMMVKSRVKDNLERADEKKRKKTAKRV
jgi:uncharacterized protein YdhG (YjbR/CyaY superfamily)